jgi:hypothetical protein
MTVTSFWDKTTGTRISGKSAMGLQMYHSVLGIPNVLKLLSEAGCICRHLEYDQYPELHVYVIAQKA